MMNKTAWTVLLLVITAALFAARWPRGASIEGSVDRSTNDVSPIGTAYNRVTSNGATLDEQHWSDRSDKTGIPDYLVDAPALVRQSVAAEGVPPLAHDDQTSLKLITLNVNGKPFMFRAKVLSNDVVPGYVWIQPLRGQMPERISTNSIN